MKKLMLLAAVAVFGLNYSSAQVSFGVKAGVNFATFLSDDSVDPDGLTSFHVGGVANIGITEKFSVQPELLYSGQGTGSSLGDFKLNYINIPVLAKFMVAQGLSIEAGPQIGFLTSAKLKELDIKEFVKSTDWSGVIGVGYLLGGGLNFGARYNAGLSNNAERDLNVDLKNSVFQLSVGYMF